MRNVTIKMATPVIAAVSAIILGSAIASASIAAVPVASTHAVVVHSVSTSTRISANDDPNGDPWT
jgi:hypothetical protein